MCSHWFSYSQWELPSESQYQVLQDLFAKYERNLRLNKDYGELRKDYHSLKKEYYVLREQYEILRRPFFLNPNIETTDVWKFKPVQYYRGKHPCEKPQDMLEHMIQVSSRPGAVVLDPFMGGGSAGVACAKLGRTFIGIERDKKYFNQILKRFEALKEKPL